VGIGRFTRLASACYMRYSYTCLGWCHAGIGRFTSLACYLPGLRIHIVRRAFSEALIVPSFINDFNLIIIKFYILNFIFKLPRRLDSIKPSTNLFNLSLLV
jgi:hypothetical protein